MDFASRELVTANQVTRGWIVQRRLVLRTAQVTGTAMKIQTVFVNPALKAKTVH